MKLYNNSDGRSFTEIDGYDQNIIVKTTKSGDYTVITAELESNSRTTVQGTDLNAVTNKFYNLRTITTTFSNTGDKLAEVYECNSIQEKQYYDYQGNAPYGGRWFTKSFKNDLNGYDNPDLKKALIEVTEICRLVDKAYPLSSCPNYIILDADEINAARKSMQIKEKQEVREKAIKQKQTEVASLFDKLKKMLSESNESDSKEESDSVKAVFDEKLKEITYMLASFNKIEDGALESAANAPTDSTDHGAAVGVVTHHDDC